MIIDVNKQRVDSAIVEMFELELETPVRFTTYPTNVKFPDRDTFIIREYISLPIIFSGYDQKSEGAYSRPTITFANILTTFKNSIGISNDDLIGKKIRRRKTLFKYLSSGTIGQVGSAPVEQPQQVFFIDRIEREDATSVTFELTSGFDLQGIEVPNRYILSNTCTWFYQGVETSSLGGCTWKKANNNPGFVVRYDANDRPIISGSIPNMPSSGSAVLENYVYRVSQTVNSVTGGTATRYDYYQALLNFTKGSTFETNNFRRCRLVDGDWNIGSSYSSYVEGKFYNSLVVYDNKVWVSLYPSTGVIPGSDSFYWERIDICGKKLTSCARRFKAVQFANQGLSVPSYTSEDNNAVLPYGGFPGARRFNR